MTRSGTSTAPGRVNLIGDHTDYNHLPVLPMAIRQSVSVEFTSRGDNRVLLEPAREAGVPADCAIVQHIPEAPQGDWRNYVHAAAQAVASESARLGIEPRGIEGTVSGDVPLAAGLSSSSALVVAVGNALLASSGIDIPARDRMMLFAKAERYVGTRGGGMDQAASIGGRAGHALLIRFDPLQVTPIPMPADWRFLVIATGTTAEKSGDVQAEYNRRVRLCSDALARVQLRERHQWSYPALLAELGLEGALQAGRAALVDEAAKPDLLGCFIHTVSEAGRVEQASDAMSRGHATRFGELMTESHISLREDYMVSSPVLEAATAAALDAGAFGARLTGAGFGGSVVALFRAQDVGDAKMEIEGRTQADALLSRARAFVARPSQGARVTLR